MSRHDTGAPEAGETVDAGEPLNLLLYGAFDEKPTGPTRVTDGLATALADRGHGVRILTNGTGKSHPHDRVTVTNVPIDPSSVREFRRVHRWVRSFAREHAVEFDAFHAVAGYGYAADLNTVQGFLTELDLLRFARAALPDLRTTAGGILYSLLKLRGVRRCDTVVTTSPVSDRQLRQYGRVTADRTIPLGIPTDRLLSPTPVGDPPKVLVVGRIEPRKGQHRVLGHLDPGAEEYELDVVGGVADEGYAARFRDRWSERMVGYVPDDRLTELYRKADIVAMPSYHETFGLVGLEAVASCCALVITDACGFAQLASSTVDNGLFVVPDGRVAAETVRNLCDRPDLDVVQQRAREYAETLTWDEVAAQYEPMYRRA